MRALRTAAAIVMLATSACSDRPAERPLAASGGAGTLVVYASVASAPVAALRAEVTAPDLATPFVFNIPIAGGVASGNVTVPAGADRRLTLRAFDGGGIEIYRGSSTITVREGSNPTVSVVLVALTGDVPIVARVGTAVLVPASSAVSMTAGSSLWLGSLVTVIDSTGRAETPTVRWASSNPARLAVGDSSQLAVGLDTGTVQLVATYAGTGVAISVTVTPGITFERFDVTPDTVDVTSGDAVVTAVVEVASAAPVSEVSVSAFEYVVSPPMWSRCSSTTPTSGTRSAGRWACTFTVQRHLQPRRARLDVSASVSGGQWGHIETFVLAQVGQDHRLTILSRDVDTQPPALGSFSIPATTLDVTSKADTLLVPVTVTDDKAGVKFLSAQIGSPGGRLTVGCFLVADSTRSYSTTCNVPVPRFAPAGTYAVRSLEVVDRVGNRRGYSEAQVQALGFATRFNVVNAAEDLAPPRVTAVASSPATVRLGDSISVTLSGDDDRSGFGEIRVLFAKSGRVTPEGSCVLRPAGGTTTLSGGVVRCHVGSMVGITSSSVGRWQLAGVVAVDAAGNVARIQAADLPGGASVHFEVVP